MAVISAGKVAMMSSKGNARATILKPARPAREKWDGRRGNPQSRASRSGPRAYSTRWSVDALSHYAQQLEEELERVRGAIRAKTDYLSKADSLFKS